MKILINFIVLCSLIIGQAEYQILTLPKNLFQLSTNGGLSSIPNQNNYFNPATYKNKKNNYGFSLIQYPSDIMMLNLNTNKFSLSILDYGEFIDQEYDTIHKKFTSNEVLLQYFYKHMLIITEISNNAHKFVQIHEHVLLNSNTYIKTADNPPQRPDILRR